MTVPIGGLDALTRAVQSAFGPDALGAPVGTQEGRGVPVPVLREPAGTSFGDTLKNAISQVSDATDRSREHVQAFLRGEPVELHQVMAAAEESGLAVDLLIQVRNKVLDAYKTIMTMSA